VIARRSAGGCSEFREEIKEILCRSLSCDHEPWLCPSARFLRKKIRSDAADIDKNNDEKRQGASSGRLIPEKKEI